MRYNAADPVSGGRPAGDAGKKVYRISAAAGSPDWSRVPDFAVDQVLWTEDTGIRAWGQMCHDAKKLYVRMSAAEGEIRAENHRPLSPVWEDSCLEFFFRPEGSAYYFNFEINPNGCLCLQAGADRADRFNIVRQDAESYFSIRTARTEGGWEVSYGIPLSFFRLFCPGYRSEGEMTGNMYKCGDKTMRPHYLSWNRIGLEKPDFHCPEFFGRLIFE